MTAANAGRRVMAGRLGLLFEGVDTNGKFVQGEVEVDDVTTWIRAEYASGQWRFLKVWECPPGGPRVAVIDVDDDGPYWSVALEYADPEATP